MGKWYSVYEAKAKFSEIIRKVREGRTVTVTYHGEPVAEVRPIAPAGPALEDRVRRLEDRGVVVRPSVREGKLRPIARRRGALERFLADRDG